jgi:hypothetical protein
MNKLQPGQTTYRQWGTLNIRIDMHSDGVSITVDHHPSLNRAFTNLDQGRAYLAFLRDEANAGNPVWLIEAGAGVLTSTSTVVDDDELALIDDINASIDEAQAPAKAENAQLAKDVAAIMADADYATWRRNIRQQAVAAVEAKNQRHDYSRTRVCRKPLTDVQADLIRNHRDGEVRVRAGQSWTVLRAIHRRIGGTPAYKPNSRIMTSLKLNTQGMALAEQGRVAK